MLPIEYEECWKRCQAKDVCVDWGERGGMQCTKCVPRKARMVTPGYDGRAVFNVLYMGRIEVFSELNKSEKRRRRHTWQATFRVCACSHSTWHVKMDRGVTTRNRAIDITSDLQVHYCKPHSLIFEVDLSGWTQGNAPR